MNRIGVMCALAASLGWFAPALAQQESVASNQYVVTYVQVLPGDQQLAEKMLSNFADFARRQNGCISFGVEKELGFPGQYAFVQEWRTNADYNEFLTASHDLLRRLKPVLAAPLDNRLGNLVG